MPLAAGSSACKKSFCDPRSQHPRSIQEDYPMDQERFVTIEEMEAATASLDIGAISTSYIPFLSAPGWAHVMIILINIWVGVPYQMLSATGILMNIPTDQLESARIDGANKWQIFWKITMPYVLFICGPSLIQSVIANINNFNVIYLLTSSTATANMAFANSNAKETDLLITWLFTLTNDNSNYKMASVIGIISFVICALLTLLSYTRMISGDKEEVYQ